MLPVLVSLFANVIPAWRERRRQQQLRDWSVEGNSGQPGYFRLAPYGGTEADQRAFSREDQAHIRVLSWLRESSEPFLYLTGVSGSGKSSVLAAHVIPNLGGDTLVVFLRASDNPLGRIREALLAPNAVWTAETASNHREDGDEELLRNAATWLNKKKFGLLLVLDQFEELLVLHANSSVPTTPLLDLLRTVAAGRCGPVRALSSLRIEFIDELTRAGLPPFTDRNHFTVGAFTDGAAKRFVSAGFDRVGQDLLDRVVAEAAALDNLVGYVRPITLNMAGQMLRRMPTGATRVSVGTRPFADYVRRLLAESDVRDQAPAILRQLVDDRNRRLHKTAREIAGAAGDVHLVNGCLTRLALPERGLTRCLNPLEADVGSRRWEVSHDFVAMVLGAVLPTLQPTLWKRGRPWLTPIVLAIWFITFVCSLPYETRREKEYQRNAAVARLSTEFGVRMTKVEDDGSLAIRLAPDHPLTSLADLVPLLNAAGNVTSLDASGHRHLENVDRCAGLPFLRTLDLSDCQKLANVEGLRGAPALQRLQLNGCTNLRHIDGLAGLPALHGIDLYNCPNLRSIDGLRELPSLRRLTLANCDSLTNVDALKGLPTLQEVVLFRCSKLASVNGLRELPILRLLLLGDCENLVSLDVLSGLTTLEQLLLYDCPNLINVDALRALPALEALCLFGCEKLASLDGLKGLTGLKKIRLLGCPLVKKEQISELRLHLKNTEINWKE